jgi:hypothetical protein
MELLSNDESKALKLISVKLEEFQKCDAQNHMDSYSNNIKYKNWSEDFEVKTVESTNERQEALEINK